MWAACSKGVGVEWGSLIGITFHKVLSRSIGFKYVMLLKETVASDDFLA